MALSQHPGLADLRPQRLGSARPDARVVLNSLQEQSLWSAIVAARSPNASQLAGARDRLASLAADAHTCSAPTRPICSAHRAPDGTTTPRPLAPGSRRSIEPAATAISSARRAFRWSLMSAQSRLFERPPLLLAGFDRILPAQQRFFAAWGDYAEASLGETASQISFHSAADPSSRTRRLRALVQTRLAANPDARLLVVTQDAPTRRGEIERAFLRFASADERPSDAPRLFEFSLGVPLIQIRARARRAAAAPLAHGPIAKTSSIGCFPADKSPPRLKSLSLSRPSCAPCATAVSSARNGPSWISSARSLGLNCPPHGPRACGSLIASSRTASPARSLRSSGPSLCPGCSSSPAGPARGHFRAPSFKLTAAGCRSSTIAPHSASMAAASRGRISSLPSIAPSPKRSSRPNRRTHQY